MHEMQCVENVMSPESRGPHTKSDDKGMNTSNKQEKSVDVELKSNIKKDEKRKKSGEVW